MRVKIAYTLNLDSLPHHLAKLLETTAADAKATGDKLLSACNNLNNDEVDVKTALALSQARDELADIDVFLEECSGMLLGYEKAQLGISLPSNSSLPSPPQPTEEDNESGPV